MPARKNMTEDKLYQWLTKNVPGKFKRVENSVGPGTPDVMYTCGPAPFADMDPYMGPVHALIELKVIHALPVSEKPLRISFKKSQVPWLTEWAQHYGVAMVLCFLELSNDETRLLAIDACKKLRHHVKLPYHETLDHPAFHYLTREEAPFYIPLIAHQIAKRRREEYFFHHAILPTG